MKRRTIRRIIIVGHTGFRVDIYTENVHGNLCYIAYLRHEDTPNIKVPITDYLLVFQPDGKVPLDVYEGYVENILIETSMMEDYCAKFLEDNDDNYDDDYDENDIYDDNYDDYD